MSLWETGNVDAQFLAVLLVKPKDLSRQEGGLGWCGPSALVWVADWLTNYVVKPHPDKETLRQEWMATDDRWAARAGWGLTAERVAKSPDGLDLRRCWIASSPKWERRPDVQWTMNSALRTSASTSLNSASGPSPSARSWGFIGTTPFEGLHVALRPDLDQSHGEPARLNEHRRIAG